MKKTVYEIKKGRFAKHLCFALVTDLHGREPSAVLEMLRAEHPDYILMAGDIFERLDTDGSNAYENSMRLLCESARLSPVFYSTGNHEDGGVRSWSGRWKNQTKKREYNEKCVSDIKASGACLLSDGFVLRDGIAFGGLLSGVIREGGVPELSWIDEFSAVEAPKVLLCHHPEYYEKYLKDKDIDLIVSGHAHGGQWQLFGRGVFAPGQGIFPKYTKGVHDGRLVISTGLKTGTIPRFFNEPEVVFIKLV